MGTTETNNSMQEEIKSRLK